MKKIKDAFLSVWQAAKYSFAFRMRNNKWGTIVVSSILLAQTLLSYGMIVIMGHLVSMVQGRLTGGEQGPFTLKEFMVAKYLFPIGTFIVALFAEITLQKFRSFLSSRQRSILRIGNIHEMNALRGSLDIARRRSKSFDDIEKKIDELPDGWYTRVAFAGQLIEFGGTIIGFIVFATSLIFTHYWYVAILIVSSVPMVIAEFTAVSRSWKLSLELIPYHKKRGVLQQAFYGSTSFLQGIMFNQMQILNQQIRENQDQVLKSIDRIRWINLQTTLAAYLVAMAGLSIVLLHAVYNTLGFAGDIGALTILVASSRRLQASLRDIVLNLANHWQSVKGVIMIEEEFFGMKPLLDTKNSIDPQFKGTPEICFEKVNFHYPDTNTLVLKNISFTIKPGSKTVVVGRNGSGKSSLSALLLRHYDPVSGDIRVGNINLRNISPKTWSEYICALLQNFAICDREVGAEIASSRLEKNIAMDEVNEAARFAGFDTVINQDPKGYSSQIGTEFGGREFSGGEEQRLALARARYRKTPFLILDEPDAKLDPESAEKLMENVFALTDTTVIIITQHVSRATKADNIIVLDGGELVEQGTHETLVARGGKYASMLNKDKERLGN